ncbi:MAG: type I-U CRISPR-associated protein Csx17 [Prochlorothrix sp.]|nr:type I-U CRISPR-associated protein Csx17 [Prochlorothrix sp.]
MTELSVVPNLSPNSGLSYLKGLGLLAISGSRGWWRGSQFVLEADLGEVCDRFLREYEPKPIAAPWNSKAGFQTGSLPVLEGSRWQRLNRGYQIIWDVTQGVIAQEKAAGGKKLESKDLKLLLPPLMKERCEDDASLDWLSACFVLIQREGREQVRINTLLGTGGNISTTDLGNAYLQACQNLWNNQGQVKAGVAQLTQAAVTGQVTPKSLVQSALLAHLSANADLLGEVPIGDENYPLPQSASTQLSNPVDYILAVEGLLLFSGSVKDLSEQSGEGALNSIALYPLLLEVNTGSANTSDRTEKQKHEVWFPLWETPLTCQEYRRHLARNLQFRLANQVRDTVDLLQLLAQKSEQLKFKRYLRCGFWTRKGQGDYLIPIDIVEPGGGDLLSELRQWRFANRPNSGDKKQSQGLFNRLTHLQKQMFAVQQGQGSIALLLESLGAVEQYQSQVQPPYSTPVPTLSDRWVEAMLAEVPTPEARLAVCLASTQLRPYISKGAFSQKQAEAGKFSWFWGKHHHPLPTANFQTFSWRLLTAWTQEEGRHHPKHLGYVKPCWARAEDLALLLTGQVDVQQMLHWAIGLSLCKIEPRDFRQGERSAWNPLPLAFRQAARLQWIKGYTLPMPAITALSQGNTQPLTQALRKQGIATSLPLGLAQGRAVAMALCIPCCPFPKSPSEEP